MPTYNFKIDVTEINKNIIFHHKNFGHVYSIFFIKYFL